MKKIISAVMALVLVVCVIPDIAIASGEAAPCFSLSTVEGESGDTVRVNLDVTNNPGITALQIQIGYSEENIELVSVEDNKLFGDAISYGQKSKNPLTISWFSSASKDVYNNGTLAVLEFRIRENAKSSILTLSYDQENVFNIDLTSIPFRTIDGNVIVASDPVETTTPNPTGSSAPQETTTLNPTSSSAPQNGDDKNLEIGAIVEGSNGNIYKVVSANTLEYSKPETPKKSKVSIPATVLINGTSYKVTSIADNAFFDNKKLKTVTIGKNVETIGTNAFYNCKTLKEVTIPAKVRKIGTRAFAYCKKLNKITIKSKKLNSRNVGKQAFKGGNSKPTVKVPKKYKNTYKRVLTAKGLSKNAIYK